MTKLSTDTRTELAHRSSDSMDVTLFSMQEDGRDGGDKVVICVCDRRDGAYFEISIDAHLALDVYYHPFAYRDFSAVDNEDRRLAA